MAVISKGIELYFVKTPLGMKPAGFGEEVTGKGHLIPNLQEIGELGSSASAQRDKIEITTLADDEHKYAQGLLSESEFDSIDFKLLFDATVYNAFIQLINHEKTYGQTNAATGTEYLLCIPNGDDSFSKFTINGTSSIKLDGAGVNAALTMTLTLTPVKEITFVA